MVITRKKKLIKNKAVETIETISNNVFQVKCTAVDKLVA